ncbi:hypothetical protein RHGRI_018266 [Rhododendron griersonianum]|uniref:Uncharacterized protein n=1 Tax=Rhododendron griersonianum TaxID=479676 RepID=A0AAV6K0Z5_9ERIC|nr:hypothetical protein RHGRI_018266 [Rhododendron griersonianum]
MTSLSQEIVLASSPDGTITAFDASSGTALGHFTGSRSPRKGLTVIGTNLIAAAHVSPDIASGSIHLYNWWSPTPSHHLPVSEPVGPLAATFDGFFLFAGGISGQIHALSLPSGDLIQTFSAHNNKPVSSLKINDDGSLLFSGGDDGTIAVFPIFKLLDISFDKSNDVVLHRFIGHESAVTSITAGVGGSNSTIISCSLDCTCKFWNLAHRPPLCTITFPCTIWGVEMDSMESEFFVAGSDGFLYSGALKGGNRNMVKQGQKLVKWEQKHYGAVVGLAMTNGGRNLVTASENGSVWIWNVERKEVVRVLGGEMGSISELVVAKGFGLGDGNSEVNGWGLEFSSREVSRPVREVMEMEKVLGVLEEDRSKAIDTLGSAIEAHEKLLGLILKEAKMGSNCDSSDEEEDDI